MKEEMKSLIRELNEASDGYYNHGVSAMSDAEWDEKLRQLKKLEEESGIILEDSPSNNAGYTVVDALPKFTHRFPNLSLDKTKTTKDFVSVFSKCADRKNPNVVLMYKEDGSTVVGYYQNGKLQHLVTRGNGYIGNEITHNAKFIKGLPVEIDYHGELIIRGEAVMSYREFERINNELPEDVETYKNPRNLATATIQSLDSKVVAEREIWFQAFNLVYIGLEQNEKHLHRLDSFSERLDLCETYGFNVVPRKVCSVEELADVMKEFTNRVSAYEFPVDGLVCAGDDYGYTKNLPGTGHNPNNLSGYAFKWEDAMAETTLRDIEWSPSRTGLINPVAVFDPVELEGTTVTRASLHNVSYIEERDIRVGDRIQVYKANMIIPQVYQSLSAVGRTDKNIVSPITCPMCGRRAFITNKAGTTTRLMVCPNPDCGAKHIGQIVHMCERDCLNVVGLSEEKITFLAKHNYITDRASLFALADELLQKGDVYERLNSENGWDVKSVNKLAETIQTARDTDFVSFMHAMSIPNFGKGQSKMLKKYLDENYDMLAEKFSEPSDNYDPLRLMIMMECQDFDWSLIEGFGEVISYNLHEWLLNNLIDPVNLHLDDETDPACEVIRLIKHLNFTDKKPETQKDSRIKGKNFVITGALTTWPNREALTQKIETMGGRVSGSVSSKTDYLINNDITSTSGKNKKAIELGIPIISEDTLNKMM